MYVGCAVYRPSRFGGCERWPLARFESGSSRKAKGVRFTHPPPVRVVSSSGGSWTPRKSEEDAGVKSGDGGVNPPPNAIFNKWVIFTPSVNMGVLVNLETWQSGLSRLVAN